MTIDTMDNQFYNYCDILQSQKLYMKCKLKKDGVIEGGWSRMAFGSFANTRFLS